MNGRTRLPLAAAFLGLLIGCRGETVSPPLSGPTFAVSDGAHNGNPDFFFLPPMFKSPSNNANFEPTAFNPNLRPTVEICELGGTILDPNRECAGAPIKTFSGNAVSISLADQQYSVNWDTKESTLLVGKEYRITVRVGTEPLGFADVDPVPTGSALKNVQTGEFIGLVDGRTLPIKFRIENGALCSEDGVACASETINIAQGGTVELDVPDVEDFKLDVPANTQATFGGQPVTEVTFNLELCDGIDVDLRTFGACLRVTTFFDVAGATTGSELIFTKSLLISLCLLEPGLPFDQEKFITLHQQDGDLIRALPHAHPNCEELSARPEELRPGFLARGWRWLRNVAGRVLAPQPLYARARTVVFNVGGGGETDVLGAECSSSPEPSAKQILRVECGAASAPQRVTTQDGETVRTTSDFQFALPAIMNFIFPADAVRSGIPGAVLPTGVKVTDWAGVNVEGARVTFTLPAIEGPGTVLAVATSGEDGIASFDWTIAAGLNRVVASGRGIASPSNFAEGQTPRPFQPDINLPHPGEPACIPGVACQEPVVVRIGSLTFQATGGLADLVISRFVFTPAELSDVDLIEFEVDVSNIGTAPVATPFQVDIVTPIPGTPGNEVTSLGVLTEFNPSLEPGESITLFTRATRAAGTYSPTATADPNLVIPESNEANNTATRTYRVAALLRGYELVVSDVIRLAPGGGFVRDAVICPVGKMVLGGGAQVVGESSADFNTRLQESGPGTVGGADDWLVSVKNEDEGAHDVRLFAVCANRASGYEVVSSEVVTLAGSGGFVAQSVQCPVGKAVLGGGTRVVGQGSADFHLRIQESGPGTIGGGARDLWYAAVKNEDEVDHTVQIYALCAPQPFGYLVNMSEDTPVEASGGFVRESVQCPAGASILSGGVTVVREGVGDFNTKIQESAPGTSGGGAVDLWLVSIKNLAPSVHSVAISAVCATTGLTP